MFLEHVLSFSPEYRGNHWSLQISEGRCILGPSPMWKTSAHLPWMGFEPTTSWSTICVLPLALHRSLQIWKRLISDTEISLDSQTIWRSFPVINISKSYMFIQHYFLATLQVSNWCAERAEEIVKSRFLSTASDDRLDSLMIIALHKYILKNIHSLYWDNDKKIIL